ncbi:hypothetical protein BDP27DRAFT_1352666, partial [Rhodocollybia butyracea]
MAFCRPKVLMTKKSGALNLKGNNGAYTAYFADTVSPEPLSCQRSQELGTKVTDPGWKQLLEDFMRFDEGDFKGLVP